MKKLKEFFSIQLSKHPGRVVLGAILLFNVIFLVISAAVVCGLSRVLPEVQNLEYGQALFATITMILDAGCISNIIQETPYGSVAVLAVICIFIVIIGMILFTGAVIGYLTNYISGFIENANVGNHKLRLSGHTVVLNWNSRGSEIVNDLLYSGKREVVVVLVPKGKESVEQEIEERVNGTIERVNRRAKERGGKRLRRKVITIVREGDVFSLAQLHDISLEKASSIIILGNDPGKNVCKYEENLYREESGRGNALTIKMLVQVADITSAEESSDDQHIVVEVDDDWTYELVTKIIDHKQKEGKCNIIPVRVNHVLGRLLSQFCLMPELNDVYRVLFSNRGMSIYTKPTKYRDEKEYVRALLSEKTAAIPLTVMEKNGEYSAFYAAFSENDDERTLSLPQEKPTIAFNAHFAFRQKNIVILGHNSKIKEIMEGFNAFREEWGFHDGENEILNVLVIDNKYYLEKMDYYREYPYVSKVVEADVYDRELIASTIETFVDSYMDDTSVLILSDDTLPGERIDADTLANLILVRDIVNREKKRNPSFDEGKVDVVVEIINPKHFEIARSYSLNNVVISNRFVSKMMTQLSKKDELFKFYTDILTYDTQGSGKLDSKEFYIKEAKDVFLSLPEECTAAALICAVYEAGLSAAQHTLLLGYVDANGKKKLFTGEELSKKIRLTDRDKLILFSNH